jgi:hypothetical protein
MSDRNEISKEKAESFVKDKITSYVSDAIYQCLWENGELNIDGAKLRPEIEQFWITSGQDLKDLKFDDLLADIIMDVSSGLGK